jgi:glycosyltransferase involved in cell wall biosynthesis
LPVQMIECEMNRWPLTDLARMADWVRSQGFDVMHTHMSRAHLYGILLRQFSGVPVVATSHTQYCQPHWYFNNHVIANSESTLRHQRRYNRVPESRLSRIHCFVDLERISAADAHWRNGMRNQWHVDGSQKVIGIIGDVVPYKGHIFLFRALPELVRRFPGLRVIVVGRFHRRESCTRQLRRFQLANGLERHVRWIGRRDNMHMVLSGVDVVAVPSLVESMGMVAVEAMAAGKPVVAARTGGLTDLVFHEENGLLVPPADPAALGESLAKILSDDKLSTKLAAGGREWVRVNLDPDNLTRQIEDVYQRVGRPGEPGQKDSRQPLGRAA